MPKLGWRRLFYFICFRQEAIDRFLEIDDPAEAALAADSRGRSRWPWPDAALNETGCFFYTPG